MKAWTKESAASDVSDWTILRSCRSYNKCIGDDTKAAARQSLNCIKNKKNYFQISIWRLEFLHPAMWYVALGWQAIEFAQTSANNGFFVKPNYRTSYRSSLDAIALNCLVFEKMAFFFAFWQQTQRQTDEQMDSTDAVSRSGCRERRLNKP